MHWYEIELLDLVLIREAKPFNPGDGSWAKGQFPPPPITVFQGLRSALPQRIDQRTDRDLSFLGPFLLHEASDGTQTLWLPTPKDLLSQFPRLLDDEPQTASTAVARLCPIDLAQEEMQFVGFDAAHFAASLTPMLPPASAEHGYGRLQPWMNADRLVDYLQGSLSRLSHTDLCDNPWTVQVLPHIQMQAGTRQVKDQDGYFTEVAVRLKPGWKLIAGFSGAIPTPAAVRLGGEGHRAIVQSCPVPSVWTDLQKFKQPQQESDTAYLLTPGLAEVTTGSDLYAPYPGLWAEQLQGCATDRPILWGGISVLQRLTDVTAAIGFTPQRAFVPPGTVYRFKHPPVEAGKLLPSLIDRPSRWLETFDTLGYGTLLWNCIGS
ncbi:CRISPR-associated protein [Microcoleus sp. FACHB-1515]|nr:CRISPR-associated protein [Microcoleus sp. FACHB-1515]